MKALAVAEFKAHFSQIIERVRAGEAFIISDGESLDMIAVLVPYAARKSKQIHLGLLQDRSLTIHDDFKTAEEALLE